MAKTTIKKAAVVAQRKRPKGGDSVAHDLDELAKLGACTPQAAHAMLRTKPSLADPKLQERLGVSLKSHHGALLDSLAPRLSKSYLTLVARHEHVSRRFSSGFAALGSAAESVKLDSAQAMIDDIDSKAGKSPRKLPQAAIDLIGDRVWALRSQHGTPTCVAYATAACIELKEAREAGPKEKPKRYSTRQLYRNMRSFGFTKKLDSALWEAGGTKFEFACGALAKAGVVLEQDYADFYAPEDWSAAKAEFDAAAPKPVVKAKKPYPKPAYFVDYLEAPRAAGEVLRLYNQLREGRAVGVAMPGFADQKTGDVSLWRSPDFWLTGVLAAPLPTQLAGDTGHGVCIVGFLPNADVAPHLPRDDFGGYFAFRNSWGDTLFGRQSPVGLPPGYGLIPAKMVEYFTLEAISF